jgi:hypothetical protein
MLVIATGSDPALIHDEDLVPLLQTFGTLRDQNEATVGQQLGDVFMRAVVMGLSRLSVGSWRT